MGIAREETAACLVTVLDADMTLGDRLRGKIEPDSLVLRPELLTGPVIPQPMFGLAPRLILGNKWWNATRREAYKSTGYRCIACGVDKQRASYRQWLEAHEVYEIDYLLGRMTFIEPVPLCHLCHGYVHDGRLRWLLESGKITQAKYAAIIQHGDRILQQNKLERKHYTGPTAADWGDWRLVLFDKEYPPLYSSFEEWRLKTQQEGK